MLRKVRVLNCLAAAALLIVGFSADGMVRQAQAVEGPEQASIEAIKVTSSGDEITVVEIINSRSIPHTTFKLIDPPRVVVDVSGVPGSDLPGITQVNDGNVTDIRVEKGESQQPGTRVVVGLARELDSKIALRDKIITITLLPQKKITGQDPQKQTEVSAESRELADAGKGRPNTTEPRIFFKPHASKDLNQILGLDFTMLDNGKSRFTVTTDKKANYDLKRKEKNRLLLTIDKAVIPSILLRRLDSSHFDGAVDQIKPVQLSDDKKVILTIYLREMVPFHLDQTDKILYIDFGPTSVKPAEKKIIPLTFAQVPEEPEKEPVEIKELKTPEVKLSESEDVEEKAKRIPGLKKAVYTGAPMTMDFVNAEVTNILRLIGEVSNLNIIWGPDVKGLVSMRLKNVPWDQALDLVLANNDLGMRRQGDVIWVTSRTNLTKVENEEKRKIRELENEKKKRLEAQLKAKQLEPLVTQYLPLDFAMAKDVKKLIEDIKTERGSVTVDDRTNTIIVSDIAAKIEEARSIARRFDTPVKQIMIEARIVDAVTTLGRDLGLRWGSLDGTYPGVVRTWEEREGTDFTEPNDMEVGGSFATNSPDGWSPNVGLSLARLTNRGLGTLDLNVSLALAESQGKAKIISSPKVIASNGEQAKISRGSTWYLAAAENVQHKEVKAVLDLEVTPTVSFNNFVSMEISLVDEKADATGGKFGKEMETKLMVKSGETIVIGGIYKEDWGEDSTGVPYLMDIPVIGWMFRANKKTHERSELMIFLTPTVLPAFERD